MLAIKKILNLYIFYFLITGISLQTNPSDLKTPVMTIFIHGIIKPPWTLGDLFSIAHNNITCTRYKYAAEYLRKSHEYYLTQPMQHLGLRPIDLDCKYPTSAASAIASVYEKIEGNKQDLYYTFGWSGFFNRDCRKMEAQNLYNLLIDELELLKKNNIVPKVRIVGFSHGGNVALNLAKCFSDPEKMPFTIDRLVLIGTPIQYETDHLINHPVFEKVYNFYSDGDVAQIADFLTTQYGVSSRIFKSREGFELPEKFKQVQLRVTKIVTNKKNKIVRTSIKDPNHLELWTFGWIQRIYREKFPLTPLPMATLLPLLINFIESLDCNDLSNHLQANIIPKFETIFIKDKIKKATYPFEFSCYKFEELKSCALQFKTDFAYFKHAKLVKEALNYAHCQRKTNRKALSKKSLKFGKKNSK